MTHIMTSKVVYTDIFGLGETDSLFSLVRRDSPARELFQGTINLREHQLPLFVPQPRHQCLEIQVAEDEELMDHYDTIRDIAQAAKRTGKHEKYHTALIEAVRNAYQHGNNKDPKKKVTLHYSDNGLLFETVVSDEGGVLRADFVPYIIFHRFSSLKRPYDFYQFSGVPQLPENSGMGTYIIHGQCDEVHYLTNDKGGLSVKMIVRKEQ